MFHFIFLFNKGLIYNSWFNRLYTVYFTRSRTHYIFEYWPENSYFIHTFNQLGKKRTFGNSLMIPSLSDSRFLELIAKWEIFFLGSILILTVENIYLIKKKRTNLRVTIGYIKRNARIFTGQLPVIIYPFLHRHDVIKGQV